MNSIEETCYDEEKLNDLIIGITAEIQQRTFDAGKHDRPWCEKADEQFREILNFIPFEIKPKLYKKVKEDLRALEEK